LFQDPRFVFYATEIVTDAQWCFDKCDAYVGQRTCYGVQIVPIAAPDTALSGFTAPNGYQWLHPEVYGSDIYVPWNWTVFDNTLPLLDNPSPNKFMCYALTPFRSTNSKDDHIISEDPHDPIFYSTCYYKYNGW
jgi:hypothetical protein